MAARSSAVEDEQLPGRGTDADWYFQEFRNYAKTQKAPVEQSSDPDFMRRW